MGKIAFVLDAGHMEGYNTGAIKPYAEGTYMWYLKDDLTAILKQYQDVDVISTKEKITDRPEVFQRGLVAYKLTEYDKVIFISLHTNAYNSKAHGTSIFMSLHLPESKTLGTLLGEAIVNLMSPVTGVTYLRGVETKKSSQGNYDYYGVIRGSVNAATSISAAEKSPVKYSYMIEHAFHDNPDECKFLVVRENIKKIAEVEADVLVKYFNLKKTVIEPTPVPTTYNENAYKEFVAGDLVKITTDLYYGSTKKIPQRILDQLWYVYKTPKNNRVVIDKNEAKTDSIMSPVDANYLLKIIEEVETKIENTSSETIIPDESTSTKVDETSNDVSNSVEEPITITSMTASEKGIMYFFSDGSSEFFPFNPPDTGTQTNVSEQTETNQTNIDNNDISDTKTDVNEPSVVNVKKDCLLTRLLKTIFGLK